MNKLFYTLILVLITNFAFAQKPPLPPLPPEPGKVNSNKATVSPKAIEVPYTTEKAEQEIRVKAFNVEEKHFTDPASKYFHKRIENLFSSLDTSVTAEQVISLTKYNILSRKLNPSLLDSLAMKAYKENENKEYSKAIETSKQLLSISPNNITGHKELALAYKETGQTALSEAHFMLLVKIIESVKEYGNGHYKRPYLINNFFEGISIYEASMGCYPSKVAVMLDKQKRLLGAYNCYHIVNYSELSHWLPYLDRDDYIVEK